ncbi:peptidoglycan-associated lipoprotein Pal [Sulfurospirillum sp. 1307]
MKKIMLASLIMAAFIFSGCSQKNPEVDMTNSKSTTEVNSADKKAEDLSGMDSNKMDANNMNSQMNDSKNDVAKVIAMLESKIDKVYFDFDKYDIRPDMKSVVEANAALLNSAEAKNLSIKVEGNCDEWGTDEYNYALGLKRAKSVKNALAALGVSEDRVMIVSYGESNPVCSDKNKACWDKNRRAEFKLLP